MDDPDRAKLREISARLQSIQQQKADADAASAESRAANSGWSQAAEFIGAVLVSGGIGIWLDRHFGTGPWATIVFLSLGFAAGIRNALRTVTVADAKTDDEKNGAA